MHKLLVIGLGGSGGKTQQFLMDHVRAELFASGWQRDDLPRCWEFVHIDVPLNPDGVGPGLPPTVPALGGTYVPIVANDAATYHRVDTAVARNLGSLRELVGWRPYPPTDVAVTISQGAGQYRGVGRMLTLSRADAVFSALKDATDRLNSDKAAADLTDVQQTLGVPDNEISDQGVMVVVVSSLAGGSGASMTLDVCNLLRGVPGLPANRTVSFMYAPDVFGALPAGARQGVNGNALAAISELLRAQLARTETWTDEEWSIYRCGSVPNGSQGRGPTAVYVVGASSGAGSAPFGSDQDDIYRGMARTLTPLLTSATTQGELLSYVVTNWDTMAGLEDHSPLTMPAQGNRRQKEVLLLGALGGSSISLGRDRYAEYVAQRVARLSVDRLLRGHYTPAVARGTESAHEAIDQRIDADYANFLHDAGLAGVNVAGVKQAAEAWVSDLWSSNQADTMAGKSADAMRRGLFATGSSMNATAVAGHIGAQVQNMAGSVNTHADQAAVASAQRWVPRFQSRIETAAIRLASRRGLPVLGAVLSRFRADLVSWSSQLAELSANSPPLSGLVQRVTKNLASAGAKAQVGGDHPLVAAALQRLREGLTSLAKFAAAGVLGDLLQQAARDLVGPLVDAVRDCEKELIAAERATLASIGVATVRTDQIAHWPWGDEMDPRWDVATNEILLEPAGRYPERFHQHLTQTFSTAVMPTGFSPNAAEAAGLTAEEVISYLSADPAQGAIIDADHLDGFDHATGSPTRIGRAQSWWPAKLATVQAPSPAQYGIKFSARDLVQAAREWVARPGSDLANFVAQGIRSALLQPAAPRTPSEQEKFDRQFAQQFKTALHKAAPLAAVDSSMIQAIHGQPTAKIVYQFTEMPLTESIAHLVRQELDSDQTVDSTTLKNFNGAIKTADQRRIDIHAMFAQAYSPLVFTSLLGPVRAQWENADENQRLAFWTRRRTQPLHDFLPVSQEWLEAFLTGWLVGRLTGEIVVPQASDTNQAVRVWSQPPGSPGGRWEMFPKNILGARGIGLDNVVGWNVPAKILETLPLAMALSCGDATMGALQPYVTVRDLSLATMRNPDNTRVPNPALTAWISHGATRPGTQPLLAAPQDVPADPVEAAKQRREQAASWVDAFQADFTPWLTTPITDSMWTRFEPFYEIAPALLTAAEQLKVLLADGEYLTLANPQNLVAAAPPIPAASSLEPDGRGSTPPAPSTPA